MKSMPHAPVNRMTECRQEKSRKKSHGWKVTGKKVTRKKVTGKKVTYIMYIKYHLSGN
jgi:hypothetical protein